MNAIRLHATDGTDALRYESAPRPEADSDELLVRVRAAGVNPLDWLVCRGMVPELRDEPLPWTPGWDVSGTVETVGTGVDEFDSGDDVCGMVRLPGAGGTFAEYVTMTADEVTSKPDGLSHVEAAGVPMAGQTAFHALYGVGGLEPEDRVLVHAAAGGVGHLAVQFAANTGAYVIGTASGHNETYLRNLGVDEFVNYREERFEDVVDDVHLVLDAVGGEVLERSVGVVRSGGTVVTLPTQPSEEVVRRFRREHGVDVCFFDVVLDSDPTTLDLVSDHVDAGVARPTISDTYPLVRAENALDRSADGHVRGKLVLNVMEETDD